MSSKDNTVLEFSSEGQVHATSAQGAVTGDFKAIQIAEDGTTFTDLTMPDATNIAVLEAGTFNQGYVIYGRCTGFTVSAGRVTAHEYGRS